MPHLLRAAMILACLALMVAACNGGDDDGDETPAATASVSVTAGATAERTPHGEIREMDLESAEDVQALLTEVGGEYVQENVIYADVTDDGVDDAVVPVASGGTMGNLAFIVLTPTGTDETATLLTVEARSRGGMAVEVRADGTILVTEPVYGPDDPECCPGMLRLSTYAWNGAALALVDEQTVDNPEGQVKPTPSPAQ